jgi:hypothetical protein
MAKSGKKLIKEQDPFLNPNDIFGDATSLSPELKKELEDQGLVPRWVSYKQMKAMDGYHAKGWRVYKRKNDDIIDNQEFRLGGSPDGYVRRGDMVLAVKTVEDWKRHKDYLAAKAERYSKSVRKQQVDDLRKLAKELNTTVVEGYDD